MSRRLALAIGRTALALLTIAAMAYQWWESSSRGVLVPLNFLSYFTIQSNAIGAAVFLVGAARWRQAATPRWDLVRGASALNLTVTFVVFALLLSNTDVDVANSWVNTVVHTIFPLAVILDWLIDPPTHHISGRASLAWLVYPLAWLAYTMIRGLVAGWYPYPFLDPANGGYGSVALYVLGILAFGIVVIAVLRVAGNALRDRRLVPLATGTPAG
ncbi:MAG TPA: Pr6Pr family membrane protein [Candidatus Limnocylindrales bacterium]|jgi:hypothetical protein|nr:Pr6Pr family membrane protein [Candidatus Limnocylindrales bacterium]